MAPRKKKPKFNVVELRPNYVPLNDIAGRLRYIADQIEKGEWGNLEGMIILGVDPSVTEFPLLSTIGSIDGNCNPLLTLTMAKYRYMQKCYERSEQREENET